MLLYSDYKKSVVPLSQSDKSDFSVYTWTNDSAILVDTDPNRILSYKLTQIVEPYLLLDDRPIKVLSIIRGTSSDQIRLERSPRFAGSVTTLKILGLAKKSDLLNQTTYDSGLITFSEALYLQRLLNYDIEFAVHLNQLFTSYESSIGITLIDGVTVPLYDASGLDLQGYLKRTSNLYTFKISDDNRLGKFTSVNFFIKPSTDIAENYHPLSLDYLQKIDSSVGYMEFDLTDIDDSDFVRVQIKYRKQLNQDQNQLNFIVVDAGQSQNYLDTTTSVPLLGSITLSTDLTLLSSVWSIVSQPVGSTATITNPNALTTTVSGLIIGPYIFRLTATTTDTQIATDDVNVTIVDSTEVDPDPGIFNISTSTASDYLRYFNITTEDGPLNNENVETGTAIKIYQGATLIKTIALNDGIYLHQTSPSILIFYKTATHNLTIGSYTYEFILKQVDKAPEIIMTGDYIVTA